MIKNNNNSLIDIIPESRVKEFTSENYLDKHKYDHFLKDANNINQSIYLKIKASFTKNQNLKLNDKNIIDLVLKSYKKIEMNKKLENDEFILTKHEIGEFLNLKENQILRYVLYRYKYNIFPKLKIIEDYPPNLQIEPTSICNLRCIMCYQIDKSFSSKSRGFMGYMKFDMFKKIIDEVDGNIEAVTFASRGEPTLHPQLNDFLKYCEGKFLGLKLNTNATLLNEKLIHDLLSSDLQQLILSIDEKNKENYEKIRVNAKFDKIMKNLDLLRNIREKNYNKTKLRIRISGVKINSEQNVEDMNNFYKEFADEIVLVNYDPWQSSYENKINSISETCSELYRRIFVWWDGKVNPCDYDYKSLLSKWNILNKNISSIWNSKEFNNLRTLHNNKKRQLIEPCKRCISI